MSRTPGEFYEDTRDRYARPLAYSALATAALVGLWANTDIPIVEPGAKLVAEQPLHLVGLVAPWENDYNMNETVQQSGKLTLDTYLGSFVNYTEARTSLKSELLGETISESKTAREGLIVSRIRFPGLVTLDWEADDEVMYLSRFEDGKEVGIPLDKALFEMQQPETATVQNGEFKCSREIEDIDYTGCIEADTVRVGYFAYFPLIGEDQGNNLQIAGEILFDEFGKIEECHFDNIFIPAFNEIYAANGITKRIDGPDAYNEVMRTFVRYFIREKISEKTPPQRVFLNITGNYTPTPSVIERIQDRAEVVDFPFQLGEDMEPNYCAQTSNGLIPITVVGEQNLDNALLKIAIGGLEQVPEGFNIQTGGFEDGKFKAASLETGLGDLVKTNVLGGR